MGRYTVATICIFLQVVTCSCLTIDQMIRESRDQAGAAGRSTSYDGSDISDYPVPGANGQQFVLTQLDMILRKEEWEEMNRSNEQPNRRKRKATSSSKKLWKRGRVYYEIIESDFSFAERLLIKDAMLMWTLHTCVKFQDASMKKSKKKLGKIRFIGGFGCSSHVGRIGSLTQEIRLAPLCRQRHIIVHEIGHALGLYHEHQRPDREEYVTVVREHIREGQGGNFNKLTADMVDTDTVPYDYMSIMHYGKLFMSTNETAGLCTLTTTDPYYIDVIGNATGTSFLDIKQVNAMYTCAGGCKEKKCPGAGYQGVGCKCWCPGANGEQVVECVEDSCYIPDDWRQEYLVSLQSANENTADVTSVAAGDQVQLRCRTDPARVSVTTCTDEDWDREPVSCDPGLCAAPEVDTSLYHAYTEEWEEIVLPSNDEFGPGTALIIECILGDYDSYANLVCKDGKWNGTLPACKTSCEIPDDWRQEYLVSLQSANENTADVTSVAAGEQVQLRCRTAPARVSVITCTNEDWDRAPVSCATGCEIPDEWRTDNLILLPSATENTEDVTSVATGNQVELLCKADPTSTSIITCTDKGWDTEPRSCAQVQCERPPLDESIYQVWTSGLKRRLSHTDQDRYDVDAELVLLCNNGLQTVTRCAENGNWSHLEGFCTSGRCPVPEVDWDVYHVISDSLEEVHRDDTFESEERLVVQCLSKPDNHTALYLCSEGQWQGDLPDCSNTCMLPVVDPDVHTIRTAAGKDMTEVMRKREFVTGEEIEVVCRDKPNIPEETFTCVDGQWNGRLMDCSGCTEFEFQCDNGSCIDYTQVCDGHADCAQNQEDEIDCGKCAVPDLDFYRVVSEPDGSSVGRDDVYQSGQSVVVHCIGNPSARSTLHCNNTAWSGALPDCGTACYEDEFRCSNGSCIPGDKVCDKEVDCLGTGEDELDCPCYDEEVRCSNGSCIPGDKVCDKEVDCLGTGEDELDCPCYEDEFRCGNGSCIPRDKVCDKEVDCLGTGEDELDCPCYEDEFRCSNGSCIPRDKVCDKEVDCLGTGDDELDCPFAPCQMPNLSLEAIVAFTMDNQRLRDGDWIEAGEVVMVDCEVMDYNSFYEEYGRNLTCTNGQFRGEFPTNCPKDVPQCSPVANANVTGNHLLGLVVSCAVGFHLQFSHHRFSCDDGKWAPFEPVCQQDGCTIPRYDVGDIRDDNGLVLFEDSTVEAGEVVTFQCPRGMVPEEVTLRCESGRLAGPYNQTVPTCRKVSCPQPSIINAEYHPMQRSYTFKDTVTVFPCRRNLEFVGNHQLVCQVDGTWSTSAACRKFCGGGKLTKRILQNVRVTNSANEKLIPGVRSITKCLKVCKRFQGFLCRSVTYGRNDLERRFDCLLHSQNPDVVPGILSEDMFWRVGIINCKKDTI